MRFILFTEGQTERNSLPHFLKRWLDPRLPQPVGVKSVNFHGWRGFVKDIPTKAHLHLKDANTIAVIGLIDPRPHLLSGLVCWPARSVRLGQEVPRRPRGLSAIPPLLSRCTKWKLAAQRTEHISIECCGET